MSYLFDNEGIHSLKKSWVGYLCQTHVRVAEHIGATKPQSLTGIMRRTRAHLLVRSASNPQPCSHIDLNGQKEHLGLRDNWDSTSMLQGRSFANIQYPLTTEEVGSALSCKSSMFD